MQQLLAHCVSASTFAGFGRQCFLWSEKTTVCRIFNCQRVRRSCQLSALSRQPVKHRLRGELLSKPVWIVGSVSARPTFQSYRPSPARRKLDRFKTLRSYSCPPSPLPPGWLASRSSFSDVAARLPPSRSALRWTSRLLACQPKPASAA
jgi:hypothetical protein